MTIVETARPVTGGVDTHLDVHVAAAVDATGGVLGVESFATTPAGYVELHGWLAGFGTVVRVGVEGTGAYGAGLARHLRGRGLVVIEVDRPNRQERRRNGKSDVLDAIEAARAALSGRASGIAKSADGDVEAIRALLVARRSARDVRIKYLNQIRHLGFTAPDELRERLRGVPREHLARTAASLRPVPTAGSVMHATKLAIRTLGRRVLDLEADSRRLDELIDELVTRTAPSLLEVYGVGTHTAAILLVAAGDNPTPAEKRSRVRAPLRRRTIASVIGEDPETLSAQPRREPPSEPCPMADRVHPHEQRRPHPQIRRAPACRRSIDTRSHPRLETLRRPRALPPPRARLNRSGVAGLAHECPDATGCPSNEPPARNSEHARHRMAS